MTQHKWHKEIHAWADGAEIEACSAGIWFSTDYPNWDVNNEFRIKPQTVKFSSSGHHFRLKEKKYLYVYADGDFFIHSQSPIGAPASWQYFGKIEVQND